ncbi:MAG TPA: hypothetical protein DEH78_13455 [Solibacterales bacterium]|nr:hypothetical protein [Bryobacterales bacterium]
MSRLLLYLCITAAGVCAEPDGNHWPQFRGPQGSGVGSDKISLPSQFGPRQALLWKTDLPKGHGSPCVWGDLLIVSRDYPPNPALFAIHRRTARWPGKWN